uniref:PI-PLC X domain-containing protein n=1 Tax=Aegilops tauschii TaxID=37682 RepID=R7WGC2_AEGTA
MAKETVLLVVAFAAAAAFLCSCPAIVSARKVGGTCALSRNCDAGLHCETCVVDGNVRPRCTRVTPVDPQSKDRGLPFNRYAWLTTHNSFARLGTQSQTGTAIVTAFNQQDTIAEQLNTPAVNVLREIEVFLKRNPSEVITIFIEDYVEAPMGLTRVFNASGLTPFLFPVWRMPKNGGDRPPARAKGRPRAMGRHNHRLLVFTSRSAKEAAEGFAHEWGYVVENQYGSKGMVKGSCPNRAESAAMNDLSRSLVLVNYFRDLPNFPEACKDNSAQLLGMLDACHAASGGRWANFIAVDFYKQTLRLASARPNAIAKKSDVLVVYFEANTVDSDEEYFYNEFMESDEEEEYEDETTMMKAVDAWDEYLRISESTYLKAMVKFTTAVVKTCPYAHKDNTEAIVKRSSSFLKQLHHKTSGFGILSLA